MRVAKKDNVQGARKNNVRVLSGFDVRVAKKNNVQGSRKNIVQVAWRLDVRLARKNTVRVSAKCLIFFGGPLQAIRIESCGITEAIADFVIGSSDRPDRTKTKVHSETLRDSNMCQVRDQPQKNRCHGEFPHQIKPCLRKLLINSDFSLPVNDHFFYVGKFSGLYVGLIVSLFEYPKIFRNIRGSLRSTHVRSREVGYVEGPKPERDGM
jgi:hypothetical protein